MRRIIAFYLMVTMFIPCISFAHAEAPKNSHIYGLSFDGVTSEPSLVDSCSLEQTIGFNNASITFNRFMIGSSIDIAGTISTEEGDKNFHFVGTMYISRKQYQGIEAYVGSIMDNTGNFMVRYFEIKNDYSYDLLKYSDSYRNKRSISFDLERNNEDYYFEIDLDALNVDFDSTAITDYAPEGIDFYEIYVDAERSTQPCIIPYDPEVVPETNARSTNSYRVVGDLWYHEQVVTGWFSSSVFEYYAIGIMTGDIVDVGTAGSSNWTSQLTFSGSVWEDGVQITNQINYFNIKAGVNVDENGNAVSVGSPIKFEIYTGSNTAITSATLYGSCKMNGIQQNDGNGVVPIAVGTVSSVLSQYRFASGATKAAAFALSILADAEPQNQSLGFDIVFPSGVSKIAFAKEYDTGVSLDTLNHNLKWAGWVSTLTSNYSTNQITQCIVQWTFNMCNGNRVLKTETLSKSVQYLANATS